MGEQQLWERVVGGHFVLAKRSFWPNFFSQLVARLQWNPMAIDLTGDAREWAELGADRRARLLKLLAGFRVGEDAVAAQIAPFADAARETTLASQESLMAWVFFLQRRDEQRHAQFFDRISSEVLALPGDTAADRRSAARAHVQDAFADLFEQRLPAVAADLAAGHAELAEGLSLYHMLLEGVVFDAGQQALLDELADGALPGVRRGRPPGLGATPPPPPRARQARARSPTGSTSAGSSRRARRRRGARRDQGADARRVEGAGAPAIAAGGRAHTGDVGGDVADD